MRWFKTKDLRSSLYALFSVSTASTTRPDDTGTMETVREAMLEFAALESGERATGLARRIRYATDLQALWFMRGELMYLLASTHGEVAARERMDDLSSMFGDMLPPGLRSRPSPLNNQYRNSRPQSDYRNSRPHSDDT